MKKNSGGKILDKPHRKIFAFGLVSFFTDISSEMIFSLPPTLS